MARAVAEVYRRFADDVRDTSPLDARVAGALSASGQAITAVEALPARRRSPAFVLAALHDLALAGQAPALAAAHATADADAAADAAVDVLVRQLDAVVAIAARRRAPSDQTGRHAVLYPAIAEAARRTGAASVGLVDVGCGAGLDLAVDRAAITYSDGLVLGDPSSPVQVSCSVVGDRPVPARAIPAVATRIGVDLDPLDATDPDDARWLHACLPPDRPDLAAALAAELAVVAADPPLLLRGDPVELVTDAVARVPADALPVVTTTWALSRVPVGRRPRFLDQLEEAGSGRPVAWVSVEGVGVAPEVPTLGDRPASGHSLIGLTVVDRSARRVSVLGRCWSRGRLLSWLDGA